MVYKGSIKDKSASLSYLRIFATLAVLCAHSWSTLTNNPQLFTLSSFEQVFLEVGWNLTKWDIPVFFMITGALFLRTEKELSVTDVLNKYSRRMLLALLIFGVPFAMMEIYFDFRTISLSMIPKALLRVINGQSFGHLWYLYTLIGIYLFLPVMKLFVNQASECEYKFVMLILFVFNFCFPLIDNLCGTTIAFELPVSTYPLFWLMLGNYLTWYNPKWALKPWVPIIGIMTMVPLVIAVVIMRGPFGAIMSYDSPVNVILAGSIFVLFLKIKKNRTKRLWTIDRLCFGVYLIHPVFIHFTYKYLNWTPIGCAMFPVLCIVYALVFIVLSFISSKIMSLISPLNKYIL